MVYYFEENPYPFVQGDLCERPSALIEVQAKLIQAQLLLEKVA